MLLAAEESNRNGNKKEYHPPLQSWSVEASLLTDIVDSLTAVRNTIVAVNTEKGKAPKFTPAPRPSTALERIRKVREFRRRQRVHEELVARVLPHRSVRSP